MGRRRESVRGLEAVHARAAPSRPPAPAHHAQGAQHALRPAGRDAAARPHAQALTLARTCTQLLTHTHAHRSVIQVRLSNVLNSTKPNFKNVMPWGLQLTLYTFNIINGLANEFFFTLSKKF